MLTKMELEFRSYEPSIDAYGLLRVTQLLMNQNWREEC